MTQHLEPFISKQLRQIETIYYMKLQVMPLCHTQTVGDYLVLTPRYNIVIECKEIKNTNEKGSFHLKRLTQLNDLIVFENRLERNHALICLLFWGDRMKKSDLFLIPLKVYKKKLLGWKKQSFNHSDAKKLFNKYIVKTEKFKELGIWR